MTVSTINSLFTLFSGETDTEKYSPLVSSAVTQVRNMLREGASSNDIRLDYLCAAVANYRYTQITCVKTRLPIHMPVLPKRREIPSLNTTFQRNLCWNTSDSAEICFTTIILVL